MAIPMVDVNYLAVIVAAIVSFVIGILWYSPFAFGKQWMKLMNIDQKKMEDMKKKGMGKSMVASFIATLIMVYVLRHVVAYSQASTMMEGAIAGFWIWLGFIATIMFNSVLWEGKPGKLYAINVAHYFVVIIIASVILTVWV